MWHGLYMPIVSYIIGVNYSAACAREIGSLAPPSARRLFTTAFRLMIAPRALDWDCLLITSRPRRRRWRCCIYVYASGRKVALIYHEFRKYESGRKVRSRVYRYAYSRVALTRLKRRRTFLARSRLWKFRMARVSRRWGQFARLQSRDS